MLHEMYLLIVWFAKAITVAILFSMFTVAVLREASKLVKEVIEEVIEFYFAKVATLFYEQQEQVLRAQVRVDNSKSN